MCGFPLANYLCLHHQGGQTAAFIGKSLDCIALGIGCVLVLGAVLENLCVDAADHVSGNHVANFLAGSSWLHHGFEIGFLADRLLLAEVNCCGCDLKHSNFTSACCSRWPPQTHLGCFIVSLQLFCNKFDSGCFVQLSIDHDFRLVHYALANAAS